ncbi:hypothetical protein ATANTOWER_024367 [Ataeniobius toweri]|uniref:Uncharacterized protein n=1 Tax=Ataeniobius toweri TaxID=208326 RepID=A0ABU7AT88_9TELE|nr:hypothetical protein [Ataeniobius toweri]
MLSLNTHTHCNHHVGPFSATRQRSPSDLFIMLLAGKEPDQLLHDPGDGETRSELRPEPQPGLSDNAVHAEELMSSLLLLVSGQNSGLLIILLNQVLISDQISVQDLKSEQAGRYKLRTGSGRDTQGK